MIEEPMREKPDLLLSGLSKQDLYEMSVEDLEARIAALEAEIARCREAIGRRQATRSAADQLFKF